MSFNRAQFLIGVLGADAALALAKAAGRSEYLAQMIVPRTILAMLEAVPAYAGTVPGFGECSLSYAKSEKGFTGNVTLGEDMYKFEEQSIFHVAGALSTAMGLDSLLFSNGRNTELQRLGKSIDLMAKAHLVGESLVKAQLSDGSGETPPSDLPHECDFCDKPATHYDPKNVKETGYVACPEHKSHLKHPKALLRVVKQELEKKAMGEGSGKTAGPVAPAAPVAPTATSAAPTTQQKLPKMAASPGAKPAKPVTSSTVKLTRSEQERACPVCSMRQFNADHKFVGCLCFRALAKSVDVTDHPEYSELHLGEDWDRETVVTFLEAVGRK
jgi:hypothetical protein